MINFKKVVKTQSVLDTCDSHKNLNFNRFRCIVLECMSLCETSLCETFFDGSGA